MVAKNPHAVALGRLGGLAGKGQPSSPKKAAAARANGRKGGRPLKAKVIALRQATDADQRRVRRS